MVGVFLGARSIFLAEFAASDDVVGGPEYFDLDFFYVLTTDVPANWIPFIATDLSINGGQPARSVKLQRAAMVSPDCADGLRLIKGRSRVLQPNSTSGVDWIKEEAVGREGVRVELRRQRVRSSTGQTYVWLGRKVGVGKGEARSGLRFDVVGQAEAIA